MSFEYNDEKHEYKIDGIVVPSVTQVLQKAKLVDFSKVGKDILEGAQYLGTAIHLACELYDDNNLDIDSLDPQLELYVDAWIGFLKLYNVEILENECRVFSRKRMFAGTLDRVALVDGNPAIIDIKSGQSYPTYPLQTAAYEMAYKECMKKGRERYKRFTVYLKSNGSFKVDEHNNQNDINVFLAALTLANWR